MIVSILRGYPFAAVLSVILVLLAVVSSVRKIRSMAKRWEDAHVPVIVKPGKYEEVLAMLRDKLERAETSDHSTVRRPLDLRPAEAARWNGWSCAWGSRA